MLRTLLKRPINMFGLPHRDLLIMFQSDLLQV